MSDRRMESAPEMSLTAFAPRLEGVASAAPRPVFALLAVMACLIKGVGGESYTVPAHRSRFINPGLPAGGGPVRGCSGRLLSLASAGGCMASMNRKETPATLLRMGSRRAP